MTLALAYVCVGLALAGIAAPKLRADGMTTPAHLIGVALFVAVWPLGMVTGLIAYWRDR